MTEHNTNITNEKQASRLPSIHIEWERYEAYLEDGDMSEEDKRVFIETLWNIMLTFVDLGFGLDPTSRVCEKETKIIHVNDTDMIRSDNSRPVNQPIIILEAKGGQEGQHHQQQPKNEPNQKASRLRLSSIAVSPRPSNPPKAVVSDRKKHAAGNMPAIRGMLSQKSLVTICQAA